MRSSCELLSDTPCACVDMVFSPRVRSNDGAKGAALTGVRVLPVSGARDTGSRSLYSRARSIAWRS